MLKGKELIKAWVKALRSGDYKQARGVLKTRDGFCCLGVLCDISKYKEWGENNAYDGFYGSLSEGMKKLAGIETSEDQGAIVLNASGRKMSLVSLNDYNRLSFNAIADLIESFYLPEEAPCPK